MCQISAPFGKLATVMLGFVPWLSLRCRVRRRGGLPASAPLDWLCPPSPPLVQALLWTINTLWHCSRARWGGGWGWALGVCVVRDLACKEGVDVGLVRLAVHDGLMPCCCELHMGWMHAGLVAGGCLGQARGSLP